MATGLAPGKAGRDGGSGSQKTGQAERFETPFVGKVALVSRKCSPAVPAPVTVAASLRLVVESAMFAAVAVVVGLGLTLVPNVELVTLTLFLAGARTGAGGGCMTAAVVALEFNYFNPLGPAPLPLGLAQAAGWALTASAGAWFERRGPEAWSWGALAAAGAGLTLAFDVATNLACFYTLAPSAGAPSAGAFALAGVGLGFVHVAGNGALFALLGAHLRAVIERVAPRA